MVVSEMTIQIEIAKEYMVAAQLLCGLREDGWSVAAHNDYRLLGQAMTFWLFTHPDGTWAKGEGCSDAEALQQVVDTVARVLQDGQR